jgi:hypothetical protein
MKLFPEVAAFLSVISLCAALSGVRVTIDKAVEQRTYQKTHANELLYANDLTGCVVFAANWPQKTDGTGLYKETLFVHVCQATLATPTLLGNFMTGEGIANDYTIHEWLELLIQGTGGSQPEAAYIVSKVGSDAGYNQNLIDYLRDNFAITIPTTHMLTYVGKKDATVVQDPWDNPAVTVPISG